MNIGVTEDQTIAGVMGDSRQKIQQKNIVDKEKNDFWDDLFNDHSSRLSRSRPILLRPVFSCIILTGAFRARRARWAGSFEKGNYLTDA
jgi:hypothetical protein